MRKVILIYMLTWGPFCVFVAFSAGADRSFLLDLVMTFVGVLYLYALKKELGK